MSELRLRSDRLQWLDLEGELIALDEEALTYLSANSSAAVLWRELAAGTTAQTLADRLAEMFDVDRVRAAEDVERFIADLRRRNLLET